MLGLRRRRTATMYDEDDPNVVVEPGPSLAKGPALLVGSILVAFGLTGLLKNSMFPSASANFPNGTAQGSSWLGFEVNGWTCFFSITAGALLLFGAAQHHMAKMMSLLVGLALAACAVIAIIDGQDVFGLAAANFWTKLGFAVAGGAMILNALMPRRMRRRHVGPVAAAERDAAYAEERPRRRGTRFGRPGDVPADEPATTVAGDRTMADDGMASRGQTPPRA